MEDNLMQIVLFIVLILFFGFMAFRLILTFDQLNGKSASDTLDKINDFFSGKDIWDE